MNKVTAGAVMEPSNMKEEDLMTYQNAADLLDILADKLKSDIFSKIYHSFVAT